MNRRDRLGIVEQKQMALIHEAIVQENCVGGDFRAIRFAERFAELGFCRIDTQAVPELILGKAAVIPVGAVPRLNSKRSPLSGKSRPLLFAVANRTAEDLLLRALAVCEVRDTAAR